MARGKSLTKLLLDSSRAAMFAGIEIHNKPHISYRYATTAMLIINAWELVLKAYVYKYINKKQIYESDGVNTKSFKKVLVITRDNINRIEMNQKFQAVFDNLMLLYDYRNTNVHYIENKLDPVIFMLLSKAVINYDIFIKKYFDKDITKDDNLIILPIGMKLPFDPIDYLKQDYGSAHNEYINRVVSVIRELDNNGIQDSIVIGFDVFADRIRNMDNADIVAALEKCPEAVALRKAIRYTDDPNAPAMRIDPDLPPLSYNELRIKAKELYPQIKYGKVFNEVMKKIKANPILCKSNYLNPQTKTGVKKDFYEEKAIEVLVEEYKKLMGE